MLENNKCEACRIGAPKVTDEEKKTFLKELPDWNILDDGVEKLVKDLQRNIAICLGLAIFIDLLDELISAICKLK